MRIDEGILGTLAGGLVFAGLGITAVINPHLLSRTGERADGKHWYNDPKLWSDKDIRGGGWALLVPAVLLISAATAAGADGVVAGPALAVAGLFSAISLRALLFPNAVRRRPYLGARSFGVLTFGVGIALLAYAINRWINFGQS